MAAGVGSGFVTAFLQTRLGVESIMAGIIVNTGLYTINLAVMGFSSTMSLVKTPTIFSMAKTSLGFLGSWYKLALAAGIIAVACAAMLGFLGTRLGLSIRATGDNAAMVRASSINPAFTITVGLCVSGALCALSGGLLAQYQKSCDINVGTGMVTIALASLIIGETLVGKRTMLRRILGVVFGSCLYRFIVAVRRAAREGGGFSRGRRRPAAWPPGVFCRAISWPLWIWRFTPTRGLKSSFCRICTPPSMRRARSWALSTTRAATRAF